MCCYCQQIQLFNPETYIVFLHCCEENIEPLFNDCAHTHTHTHTVVSSNKQDSVTWGPGLGTTALEHRMWINLLLK